MFELWMDARIAVYVSRVGAGLLPLRNERCLVQPISCAPEEADDLVFCRPAGAQEPVAM